MKTGLWRAAILTGAVSLVAAACAPAATPPGATPAGPGATPAAPQPVKGGRVVEGSFSDIKTMNPILVQDVPSSIVTSLQYDGLIEADPKSGEPKPRMATFELGKDGLSYTYTIGANVNWSDGKPVIAEDYLVAKKLVALSKVTVRKSMFQDVIGFKDYTDGKATEISGIEIDKANPKKFTVKLSKVNCDGIFNVSNYVMPAHVFGKYATPDQKDAIDKAPENTNPQVVNGPFKFKEWRQGDQVILTRNDTYFRGAPLLDEYVYKVVADSTVIAAQLKTGELTIGTVDPKDLADIETQEHLKVTKTQQLGYTYIGWRTDSKSVPAFGDKRVRQALAYGLNMDDVVKAVLFGQGVKQVAHHVPVQWAYPDPKTLNSYAFDPKKAEELIQQAGYKKNAGGIYEKDGKPIAFTIRTNAGNKSRETLAQVAAEQYKKIGLDVKTSFEQFQGLVDKLTTGDPSIEAVIIGWSLGASIDPHGIWHSSQIPDPATKKTGFGFTAFKSAELDKLIDDGRSPANGDCSVASRKKTYEKFNQILNDEQPYNFGFSQLVLNVSAKSLQGFDPGPFSTRYNIEKWWHRK
jgi:peptide/nickel transport system substrate-binding protein